MFVVFVCLCVCFICLFCVFVVDASCLLVCFVCVFIRFLLFVFVWTTVCSIVVRALLLYSFVGRHATAQPWQPGHPAGFRYAPQRPAGGDVNVGFGPDWHAKYKHWVFTLNNPTIQEVHVQQQNKYLQNKTRQLTSEGTGTIACRTPKFL